MHSRSFFYKDFVEVRALKLERFSWLFLDEAVIRAASKWVPKLVPISGIQAAPIPTVRVVRLVLPYTRRWNGLAAKLEELHNVYQSTFLKLNFVFRTQLSWSRGGQALCNSVKLQVPTSLHVFQQAVRAEVGRTG